MDRTTEASRYRQQIADGLAQLTHWTRGVQGRETMLRASLYRYRRRCGSPCCRCERGQWHHGQALSVSAKGRSRTLSLAGLDRARVRREVEAYRRWRQARARMVRIFREVLEAVDRLGQVRTVSLKRLRPARVSAE